MTCAHAPEQVATGLDERHGPVVLALHPANDGLTGLARGRLRVVRDLERHERIA